MEIKRNDPCPCGSGKKYKKCCLNKANVIKIQEVKEERFFQDKHMLVLKLRDFLNKKVPPTAYYQLQSEFKKRSLHSINDKLEKGFFEFWLFFFHRFENGLRGIEWFTKENGPRLSQEEKQMADTWQTLTPKIVQAVNKEEDIIHFEDVLTKEKYHVAYVKDNVPFAPWYGTITLLEPFDDLFYFNGVRIFEDPNSVNRAVKKAKEIIETTKQSQEQVMIDYFPEILAALVTNDETDRYEKREIKEYTLQYKVLDDQALLNLLQSEEQFDIDTWDQHNKRCSWVGNWYKYSDNEISGPIHIAEVYGKLTVENNLLQFNSLDQTRVEEFEQIIQTLIDSSALSYGKQKTNSLSIPFHAEIRDLMVTLDKDTPQYFALYAQNDVRFEFDKPLRQFNGLSIKELIEAGREDDAENWLKQMEYNMYLQVNQQFKNVETTADFNTVRKELGFALSSFVTGGDQRESTFEPITPSNLENQHIVKKEDIPYYEQLGFTPDTIDNFYAADFVTFFKEKTVGKSENTIRKYRSSLSDLRVILEQQSITGWEECGQAFWRQVYALDFMELYELLTKTAVKDFVSTTKSLAKWLDQEKRTSSLSKIVVQVTKETEEQMLRSEVVNTY
ncbi:MAG: YecA family protein [Bacillota bacterium]